MHVPNFDAFPVVIPVQFPWFKYNIRRKSVELMSTEHQFQARAVAHTKSSLSAKVTAGLLHFLLIPYLVEMRQSFS